MSTDDSSPSSASELIGGVKRNVELEKELARPVSAVDPVDPFRTIQRSNAHVPFSAPSGPLRIQYFGEQLRALNKEVEYHGELRQILAMDHAHEWETRLAHVAAYCGIPVDGYFNKEGIEELAAACLKALYNKRIEALIPVANSGSGSGLILPN